MKQKTYLQSYLVTVEDITGFDSVECFASFALAFKRYKRLVKSRHTPKKGGVYPVSLYTQIITTENLE